MSACQKLNHKQRRKLWRKEKRRKKRIQACLERISEQKDQHSDSEGEEDEDEENNKLPIGELTNFAIICHFRAIAGENKVDVEPPTDVNGNQTNVGVSAKEGNKENAMPTVTKPVELPDPKPMKSCVENDGKSCAENNDGGSELRLDDGDDAKEDENKTKDEKDEMKELLSLLDEEVEQWQNPPAPEDEDAPNINPPPPPVTVAPKQAIVIPDEKKQICLFYSKVGACRYGERCSRRHVESERSAVLLFPNMFHTYAYEMEERSQKQTGDDHGISLEHSDRDLQSEFLEFHDDVLPEFQQIGRVRRLYVCCNRVRHLRGNVYVQYEDPDAAKKCHDRMFGRFYNGKQLTCKFVAIASWGGSLCGDYMRSNDCPRGGACNFMHIFFNPNHWQESAHSNRQRSNDDRRYDRSHRHSRYSPRYENRRRHGSSSRHTVRNGCSPSYSPDERTSKSSRKNGKHGKNHTRKEEERKRSRSKSKRRRSNSREKNRKSRSPSSDQKTDSVSKKRKKKKSKHKKKEKKRKKEKNATDP